jgi:outer membrane protein assembly factor BamD
MLRRIKISLFVLLLVVTVACTNKKVSNPIASVDSKQPDKVLFDKAMDAMKHNRYDVARLTLQTMINTYPDSEYIARAKLSLADSWYDEGGTASLAQAEAEYNDFKTFFPNMPEAAEAQLKIANIHYEQMEKPDRDFTHALRAEEEYRNLISEFPDSKLVPEAKKKLLQVQEVVAEREFEVGKFYYLRQSYPAAIARLRTLEDRFPLYSKADEGLYLLGQSYEGELKILRARPSCTAFNVPKGCINETAKSNMLQDFTKHAADAYSRIITRYPLMDRADDAKKRLADLKMPIPRPTKAEVAQNKAEIDSRKDNTMVAKVMHSFAKHPDVSSAVTIGEPTLVDSQPMSPSDVVREANAAAVGGGGKSVSVEAVGSGPVPAGEAAPRSDTPAPDAAAPETSPDASASAPPADNSAPPTSDAAPAAADPNELKPNVAADSATAPAPQQVNEIQSGAATTTSAGTSEADQPADDKDISSSKPKKKKGLEKLNPF